MELTIHQEGKAITKLKKDLMAYHKSLNMLKQMNHKQGSAAVASMSTDAMDQEQHNQAADKLVSTVPMHGFNLMLSDEVNKSLVQLQLQDGTPLHVHQGSGQEQQQQPHHHLFTVGQDAGSCQYTHTRNMLAFLRCICTHPLQNTFSHLMPPLLQLMVKLLEAHGF